MQDDGQITAKLTDLGSTYMSYMVYKYQDPRGKGNRKKPQYAVEKWNDSRNLHDGNNTPHIEKMYLQHRTNQYSEVPCAYALVPSAP